MNPGQTINPVVLLVLAVGMLGAMIMVGWLLFRGRPQSGSTRLTGHYQRLGTAAPDDPCPRGHRRRYQECCRAADVSRLTADVNNFLLQRWSRRSRLGRRQNQTMSQRLADHPLPEATLPDWVSHPERHPFPIAGEILRRWTPEPQMDPAPPRAGMDADANDLF